MVASNKEVSDLLLEISEITEKGSKVNENNLNSLQTRQMLCLRALSNTFNTDEGRKMRSSDADEVSNQIILKIKEKIK